MCMSLTRCTGDCCNRCCPSSDLLYCSIRCRKSRYCTRFLAHNYHLHGQHNCSRSCRRRLRNPYPSGSLHRIPMSLCCIGPSCMSRLNTHCPGHIYYFPRSIPGCSGCCRRIGISSFCYYNHHCCIHRSHSRRTSWRSSTCHPGNRQKRNCSSDSPCRHCPSRLHRCRPWLPVPSCSLPESRCDHRGDGMNVHPTPSKARRTRILPFYLTYPHRLHSSMLAQLHHWRTPRRYASIHRRYRTSHQNRRSRIYM